MPKPLVFMLLTTLLLACATGALLAWAVEAS